MFLIWGDVLVWPWKSYLYMETHNSITIFYSARRRRKIFQIVLEKINFGPKIRVPPPGKIQKFHFLAKTFPPQPKKKFVSPPREIISEIFIPTQKFGVKSHYVFHRFSRPRAIKNDGSYDKIRQNLKKWIFGPFWDR